MVLGEETVGNLVLETETGRTERQTLGLLCFREVEWVRQFRILSREELLGAELCHLQCRC